MALAKPNKGDIVEVEWFDSFRYTGEFPEKVLTVKSFGMFEFEDGEGVALIQNEVQIDGVTKTVDRIMDAQFILLPTIINISILRKVKK